jgi:hypothetical protein
MKVHLKFHDSNKQHTRTTVFINGANVGELCLLTEDIVTICLVLSHGLNLATDEFVSSGYVYTKEDEDEDSKKSE